MQMGRKMATKNCNPSQVFSLFHDYPIMINLFNNFEALLGRWGEGKRGAGCFITHFDHEIQAAGKLNSFLFFVQVCLIKKL